MVTTAVMDGSSASKADMYVNVDDMVALFTFRGERAPLCTAFK
jgi:hypothetical protein